MSQSPDLSELQEEELWSVLREAVERLDELTDRHLIESGDMEEDEVPSGQSLGNMVVVYSMTYFEEGQLRSIVTNMVPPGTLDESVVGLLRIAERQTASMFDAE